MDTNNRSHHFSLRIWSSCGCALDSSCGWSLNFHFPNRIVSRKKQKVSDSWLLKIVVSLARLSGNDFVPSIVHIL